MAHHVLTMPTDERQVRELRAGDTVTLEIVRGGRSVEVQATLDKA